MRSKFLSQSKILLAAVPVKGVGWISVEGFVVSCVKSWFINCTGSIYIGSSGKEMTKELSLESVQELSNDCDSWSRSVRRSWAESIRESVGDCRWRLTVVSKGVRCGNWTTVFPRCIDQGSLTIPGWKSGKSGHLKIAPDDGVVVVCLKPKSNSYEVPPGGLITGVSGWLIIVDVVRLCVCKSSFLILTNCGKRNNKITNKQKRSSLLAVFATTVRTVLVQIKKILIKRKQKRQNE